MADSPRPSKETAKPDAVVKIDNSGLKEPASIPASPVAGKSHVDLYLKVKGVPLWERGGMRAFAQRKSLEFGTDQQFNDLFKSY